MLKVLIYILIVLAALCLLGFVGLYFVYYFDLDTAMLARMEAKAKSGK